jgi:predicted transposase YbfD/YdcC
MHCTLKKTTQLIIEGGNDYIVTVKANQPRLLAQLETLAQQQKPKERFVDVEKKRGRITCRIVNLFTDTSGIDFDWIGLQSLIQVERIGIRQGKPLQQTNYYISSLFTSAVEFAQAIRAHWGIENRLHWVKDVIFGEDTAPFRDYNAATNWSFIRTLAINVARMGGYDSLTKAERFLAHNIDKIFSLLE